MQRLTERTRERVRARDAAGAGVALDLCGIERDLDAMLSRMGQGLSNMADGRIAAGLPVKAGQAGLERFGEALNHIIAGRGALARAHDGFARDGRALGVDWTVMGGPTETTPLDPEKDGRG